MKEDVNVIVKDLPHEIKGHVNQNRDGSRTIVVNARLNYEQQMEVLKHETNHIIKEDFASYDVNIIEF